MSSALAAQSSSSSASAIERAASLHTKLFFAYIVLLALTALLTYLVWRSGNRLQDAIRADADAKIAEARKDAAVANENTARLALKVEEEARKRAEAERALLELQQRLAPRVITEEQARMVVASLSRFRGQKLKLFFDNRSEEIVRFGEQLLVVLRTAGLEVDAFSALYAGPVRSGITARVGKNRVEFATAISVALGQAGIVDGRLPGEIAEDPTELELLVWPKK